MIKLEEYHFYQCARIHREELLRMKDRGVALLRDRMRTQMAYFITDKLHEETNIEDDHEGSFYADYRMDVYVVPAADIHRLIQQEAERLVEFMR